MDAGAEGDLAPFILAKRTIFWLVLAQYYLTFS